MLASFAMAAAMAVDVVMMVLGGGCERDGDGEPIVLAMAMATLLVGAIPILVSILTFGITVSLICVAH